LTGNCEDVGAQGISGEVLLPETRREFHDATRGMFADPLQEIDQVGVEFLLVYLNVVDEIGRLNLSLKIYAVVRRCSGP
jgi:hypothetical protein